MGDTIREVLEANWGAEGAVSEAPPPEPAQQDAAPVEPEGTTEAVASPPEESKTDDGRPRNPDGTFAPKPKDAPSTPKNGKPPEAAQESAEVPPVSAAAPKAEETPSAAAPPVEALRAPQSWKPLAREEWAKVPPSVQAEVMRREKETAQALQQSADSRRFTEEWQQVVAPHAPVFQMRGVQPLDAVKQLLQMGNTLLTAPEPAKAQMLAAIANANGVSVEALANAFDNSPAQPQGQQPQQLRDPRVDEILAYQAQQRQQMEAQQSQRVASVLESFGASHEFFEDVRGQMAAALNFVDPSESMPVAERLEKAYSLAVSHHPELSKVMAQREAAKQAANATASTQRAKAAASSVRSAPAGIAPQPKRDSIRAELEANWESVNGR